MASTTAKSCVVALDLPEGPRLCTVRLAASADLEAALQAARLQVGDLGIDWQSGPVGIWGQLKARTAVPDEGDRIELYRPLRVDPRQRRRERARTARR